MKSQATTVTAYLASLPPDRRASLRTVRSVIKKHLDPGYEEGMQYGMIGYYVPHRLFPAGYHVDPKQPLPLAALASQKNHLALYLMGLYGDPELDAWFREAWAKSGKRLDLGKSCLRFKKVEDLALDVLAQAFDKLTVPHFLSIYEKNVSHAVKKRGR